MVEASPQVVTVTQADRDAAQIYNDAAIEALLDPEGDPMELLIQAFARHASGVIIDLVLHCPKCGLQHIDEVTAGWDNPPHRSHLCHECGCIWRPADVSTNGVGAITTVGKADNYTLPTRLASSGGNVVGEALERIPADAFWQVGHDGEGADPSMFKARIFEPMTMARPIVGIAGTPAAAIDAALAHRQPEAEYAILGVSRVAQRGSDGVVREYELDYGKLATDARAHRQPEAGGK